MTTDFSVAPTAWRLLVVLLTCSCLTACKSEWEPTEVDHILSTVGRVGDVVYYPDGLAAMFVEGSAPDDKWRKEALPT